eukprot:CAMPEP_0171191192 /NCGR_PEP_ID=MMETSP0790-20130122/19239_1 /TAXON_ID=2925 /ORGANISM="Alexandrium catenella, Strain OF101" /LENGTH=76 /DNA_ID=CAMNT_0011656335 /DNA_START=227 /DNA_END=453 /DNA_ORIENTATION=+
MEHVVDGLEARARPRRRVLRPCIHIPKRITHEQLAAICTAPVESARLDALRPHVASLEAPGLAGAPEAPKEHVLLP